ncbi:MAG: hypothetical protein ACREM8_05465 [Vulcanimicrobiaceae bacterium]
MSATTHFLEQLALWSQIIGALAFLAAMIWIFQKYLLPAVGAAERAKNAAIREAEDRRDRAKGDVIAARAELDQAERDAVAIRARVVGEAQREHERIIAETLDGGERLVRNAEGELDRARLAGRARLRDDLVRRALEIAREQAPGKLDPALNARLVGDVVARLERGRR